MTGRGAVRATAVVSRVSQTGTASWRICFSDLPETRCSVLALVGFLSQFAMNIVPAIVGTGAMATADYVAIGVLIVLGVFAIAAVSGRRFKL
jgi:hypothetical protein